MANPTSPIPISRTAIRIGVIALLLIAVLAGVGYSGASAWNTLTEVDTIGIVAVVAACLVLVVVVFQLALAAGTPWAAAAYGGRAALEDGTLPGRYRVASVISGVVLLGVLWLVLAAGRVIARGSVPDSALTVGAWVLTVLFLLNTLGNLRGRHPLERWGFSAITTVLAVLCAAIALIR